jgi:hypothetical protein
LTAATVFGAVVVAEMFAASDASGAVAQTSTNLGESTWILCTLGRICAAGLSGLLVNRARESQR